MEPIQPQDESQTQSSRVIWIIAGAVVIGLLLCVAAAVVALVVGSLGLTQRAAPIGPQAAPSEAAGLPPATAAADDPVPSGIPFDELPQSLEVMNGAAMLAIGNPAAPVTLEEYADFSCPHCRDLAPAIEQIVSEYGPSGEVRLLLHPIVFVNPPYSVPAGAAALCAAEQGQFWQVTQDIWVLFDQQGPSAYEHATLRALAADAGLEPDRFGACLESERTLNMLQATLDQAAARGVQGTPTLYLNGMELAYRGADAAYGDISAAIDRALDDSQNNR